MWGFWSDWGSQGLVTQHSIGHIFFPHIQYQFHRGKLTSSNMPHHQAHLRGLLKNTQSRGSTPALLKLNLRKFPRNFTFKSNIPGDSNQQSLQNVHFYKVTLSSVFYYEYFQTYRKIQRIFSEHQYTHDLDSTRHFTCFIILHVYLPIHSTLHPATRLCFGGINANCKHQYILS